MLDILGFQPIYKACIGNYLVPTCHSPPPLCPQCAVEASRAWWWWGGDDRVKCYYVQKNYASFTVPCPTLSPSLPHLTFPSLSVSFHLSSSLLPPVFIYLSCHSPSLSPYSLSPSPSFFLFLSVVLFFILLPLCLSASILGEHGVPEPV